MLPLLRSLPNILTGSRLFLTAGFLVLLGLADPERLSEADIRKLDGAFILLIITGLTDILDGPLARRLKATSSFGRRFDPLVDKIVVGAGFIMLALIGKELTGIAWWMVAVILIREGLVTALRSFSEVHGQAFHATWAGKMKMSLQSITIGTIIVYLAYFQQEQWALILRDITVWITVIFTVLSASIYLPRWRRIKDRNCNKTF